MKYTKRGLSDLVATVLIVLLSLAAVAIVWGFLQPAFERSGVQTELRSRCFGVDIEATSCTYSPDATLADVTVNIRRKSGDITKIRATVTGKDGATPTDGTAEVSGANLPGLLETYTFGINGVDVTAYPPVAGSITHVTVAGIVSDGVNEETCTGVTIPCTFVP